MFPQYIADSVEKALDRSGSRAVSHLVKTWSQRRRIKDTWFYVYKPDPGDTIVDVGAGDGVRVSIMAQYVGKQGRILAIEAHPRTYHKLLNYCATRNLANVTCLNLAVADRSGTAFVQDRDHHESNMISFQKSEEFPLKVTAESLDRICKQQRINIIDFLKMNIEGAEKYAINGMEEMIRRTRYALIACHDFLSETEDIDRVCTKNRVVAFFERHNFEVIVRDDHPCSWVNDHVHAINRDMLE